jgi:AcrR family transcriptional regulator
MRDGAKTRTAITTASLKLFVEQGFAETTTRDIASAAGVAEGTLYRHYASKEAIAWTIYRAAFERLGTALQGVMAAEAGSFAECWQRVVTYLSTLFDEEPLVFRYLLLAQHEHARRIQPGMASPVEAFRQLMEAGMQSGEIVQRPNAVATALALGPLIQLATFALYGSIDRPLTPLAPEMAAAGLAALRTPRA